MCVKPFLSLDFGVLTLNSISQRLDKYVFSFDSRYEALSVEGLVLVAKWSKESKQMKKIDTVVSTKSSCFDNWNGSFNSFQMKSFVSFPFKIEFIVLIFAFGCFDFERFTSATWWCYLTVSKRITSIKSILAWKVSSTNAFSWFCQMNIVHFDLSNFFSYEKSEGWI